MLLGSLYCKILTNKFLLYGVSGRSAIVVTCVCPSVCPSVRELYLVCTITHHIFELESLNLYQTCFLGNSQLVLKIGVIDLDLQGHFSHFVLKFLEIQLVSAITLWGYEVTERTCLIRNWIFFNISCILWHSVLVKQGTHYIIALSVDLFCWLESKI